MNDGDARAAIRRELGTYAAVASAASEIVSTVRERISR
jgi:hypothetical protein